MQVELIYHTGCPAKAAAQKLLKDVLDELEVPVAIQEWNTDDEQCPIEYRTCSSPTILVEGQDIDKPNASTGRSCRIYKGEAGDLSAVPPRENIKAAIQSALSR